MADHRLPRPPSPSPYTLGPVVLDRLGHPLGPGALVQYIPAYPLIFTVTDVRPNVDPRAPQGSAVLTLECRVPVPVPGRQALPMLLVVGQLAPAGQGEPVPGAQAPGPDVPGTSEAPAPGSPLAPVPSVPEPSDPPAPVPGAPGPGPRLVTPAN